MTTQRSMLVTGGSSGLGLAIARAAAADGYRVGVLDPAVPAGGNGANLVVYAGNIPTAAPEPLSVVLLGVGLAGLGVVRNRRKAG